MKLKPLRRSLSIEDVQVDEENRIIQLSFSSEYPVDRWFGSEILSHAPGSCDLSRLNGGANLLWNHDMDAVIGVIEGAEIRSDQKKGIATVRFSKSPDADQKFQDVKDKIIQNVSFGYRVDEMQCMNPGSDEEPVYMATKWTPFEISLVSIPADPTVGVGRSAGTEEEFEVRILSTTTKTREKTVMTEEEKRAMEAKIRVEAMESERARIATISAMGEKFNQKDLARQLIDGAKSIEDARKAIMDTMDVGAKPVQQGAANLDMSEKEKRSYSLIRAVRAALNKDWKEAGFERECSETIAKRLNRPTEGFFLPMNITLSDEQVRAAYATSATNTGGATVGNNLLSGSFIDILRNKAMVMQLGAKMLSGLVGNVTIPRQSGATAAYWVAEGSDTTEAEGTFDVVSLTPKQIAARSLMTRLMLQQSTPDIEAIARNDLALVLALGIDLASISGSGSSGQPKGILNQTGIGSVAMGTNGGAITLDALIDLETQVATANADMNALNYLTNAKAVGALKKLKSTTGQYLWTNSPIGQRSGTPGEINGYPVGRSNQVASNLTKGTSGAVCSAVLFGNWNDLIIGEWGTLEILPNPYGAGYASGGVELRAMQTVDVAVRHPESFAAITDALTS